MRMFFPEPRAAVDAFRDRIPAAHAPGGAGWCAAMACMLEASAPKPGNVHPGAAFPDLSYPELMAAALAIAPPMDRAACGPLGAEILAAVRGSSAVTRSNANLGIILTIAPLAGVPPETWSASVAQGSFEPICSAASRVLAALTAADAADIWLAITLARPGGLGTRGRFDLADPPPTDILEAMRLAASHDQIAGLWAHGYHDLCRGLTTDLAAGFSAGRPWPDVIVDAFLRQLARAPDSLVARKHGSGVAADVSARAAAVLEASPDHRADAVAAFDRSLRVPVRINPGTTADLVAGALYILFRSNTP